MAAFASPPAAAALAAALPFGPCLDLSFDNALLGCGEQGLALRQRQREIFSAFDAFAQRCEIVSAKRRAVIGSDLKQNLHVHDVSPDR